MSKPKVKNTQAALLLVCKASRRRFDTFLGRGRDTISERDHAALRRKIFNNTKQK